MTSEWKSIWRYSETLNVCLLLDAEFERLSSSKFSKWMFLVIMSDILFLIIIKKHISHESEIGFTTKNPELMSFMILCEFFVLQKVINFVFLDWARAPPPSRPPISRNKNIAENQVGNEEVRTLRKNRQKKIKPSLILLL